MDNNTSTLSAATMAIIFLVIPGIVGGMLFDTAYSQTGEPFYVEQTKSTGIRVVDRHSGPKVEVSFAGNGRL